MGGGGKGGGSGDTSTTVRYAGYIEDRHKDLLSTIVAKRTAVIDSSPYSTVANLDHDVAYFGTGFVLADFPSLYDMYGKFMAGLDVDALLAALFADATNSPLITSLVAAEAALMDNDLVTDVLPRYQVGMRDINSVISSTYAIGKTQLENARARDLDKFSAELRYRLIPITVDVWQKHLDWNKGVVLTYAEIMKLYFSSKMDIEDHNQEVKAKNLLWPFTVLEYERAAIGALQGATTTTSKVAGASGAAKAISGALGGAAMGGMLAGASGGAVGGPAGMIVGGLLGLVGSFL